MREMNRFAHDWCSLFGRGMIVLLLLSGSVAQCQEAQAESSASSAPQDSEAEPEDLIPWQPLTEDNLRASAKSNRWLLVDGELLAIFQVQRGDANYRYSATVSERLKSDSIDCYRFDPDHENGGFDQIDSLLQVWKELMEGIEVPPHARVGMLVHFETKQCVAIDAGTAEDLLQKLDRIKAWQALSPDQIAALEASWPKAVSLSHQMIADTTKFERYEFKNLRKVTELTFIADEDDVNRIDDRDLQRVCGHALEATAVRLVGAKVTSLGMLSLRDLKQLEVLQLAETQIDDDGINSLLLMERLKELGLEQTRVTSSGLASLDQFPALERLSLRRTAVDDEGLEHVAQCWNLTQLDLAATSVSDQGITHLKRLQRLELLDLSGTQVSQEEIEALERSLPKLKVRFE